MRRAAFRRHPAEFGLLVLDNWCPPQTIEEAYALLANAKTLRALGEQTTRASWVDLADAQETAVGVFLCFPDPKAPEVGTGRELVVQSRHLLERVKDESLWV
jgi:hypothetical protein